MLVPFALYYLATGADLARQHDRAASTRLT